MAFFQIEQIVEPVLVVGRLQVLGFDCVSHGPSLISRPLPLALLLGNLPDWFCFPDAHCQ